MDSSNFQQWIHNCSSADGFLVLGHDVDRYSADDTIPIWDKYGFEKMQSFSGAMSQLNFWRQWIPDTQIKDMAFCKGTFVSTKIAFWKKDTCQCH